MTNTVFPHKFWRPFLDCMPRLFFRPKYVWFPVHLKGLLIPLWYETLVVNWQNWLFTLFHQSRSVLSPNPIRSWVSNYTPSIKILDQLHSTLCTSREVLPCLVDKINVPAKFSRYPAIDPKFALWVKWVVRKLAAGCEMWIWVHPV